MAPMKLATRIAALIAVAANDDLPAGERVTAVASIARDGSDCELADRFGAPIRISPAGVVHQR